ncbi:MAG TPA: 6-phosphofructokinase [Bryobacteraceae bacterium]|nr:6-phosphofructokinase [Bryobacteraceae bacterium]
MANHSHLRAAVIHSGGPTAVLNASLAGVVDACREKADVLYGVRFGVNGLLSGDLVDLLLLPPERMHEVALSPGSFLGSTRRRLEESDYEPLRASLSRHGIRTLFYTGGNGSMTAALDIAEPLPELQVIGIPKTIDNDLAVTAHTPGYASTAYFFACAARDAGIDNQSLPSPICILETLGRDVGWIVAATSLARAGNPDSAPHLIYFAERPLPLDRIATDVERVYRRLGRVFIAVCEGQFDGQTLAKELTARLGIRARAERPGLVGRSCGPFARERDRRESYRCGRAAVQAALRDESGVMVALNSDSSTFLTPLETVAGKHRRFPLEWISEEANDVTDEFHRYAAPLIGPIDRYPAGPTE